MGHSCQARTQTARIPTEKNPFPPCNPHPGDDPYGIEDICNIYDWIDSP